MGGGSGCVAGERAIAFFRRAAPALSSLLTLFLLDENITLATRPSPPPLRCPSRRARDILLHLLYPLPRRRRDGVPGARFTVVNTCTAADAPTDRLRPEHQLLRTSRRTSYYYYFSFRPVRGRRRPDRSSCSVPPAVTRLPATSVRISSRCIIIRAHQTAI